MQEVATFGAGCFWGVEPAFRRTPGVNDAAVGYSGGDREKPTYKDVCSDETGHAEGVQVTFDPQKLSYSQLLDVFWEIHDPTQVNRQGPDFGKYRTAIVFHAREQEEIARNQSRRWNPEENFAIQSPRKPLRQKRSGGRKSIISGMWRSAQRKAVIFEIESAW
jgi:peptide-methionine (S)-S-oxide reductase